MVLPVGFISGRQLSATGGGGWIWNGTFDTNTNSCALMGTTVDGYLYLMGTNGSEVSLYGFDMSDGSVVFNTGMSYVLYKFWQHTAENAHGTAGNNRQLAGYKVGDNNHRLMLCGQYWTSSSYATQNSPSRFAMINFDHDPTTHAVTWGVQVQTSGSINHSSNYFELRPAISQVGDGGRYVWVASANNQLDYNDGFWAQLPIMYYDMADRGVTYAGGRLVDKANSTTVSYMRPSEALTFTSASGNSNFIGTVSTQVAGAAFNGVSINNKHASRIGPYTSGANHQRNRWFVKTGGANEPFYACYGYSNPYLQKFNIYNYNPNAVEQSESVWRISGFGSGVTANMLCMKRNAAEDRIYILLGSNQDNDITVVELDTNLAKQNEWSISCSSTTYWTPSNYSSSPIKSLVNMEVVTEDGTDFLVIYHKKDASNAGTIMKLPADGSALGTYGDYTIGSSSSSYVYTGYSVVTSPTISYLGSSRLQYGTSYLDGFPSNVYNQFSNANNTGSSSVGAVNTSPSNSYAQYSQNALQSV